MRPVCLALIVCSLALGILCVSHVEGNNGDSEDVDTSNVNQTSAEDQEPSTNGTEQLATCPEGTVLFKQKCLYFSDITATYWEQPDLCWKMDFQPTEVLSSDMYDFIQEKADDAGVEYMLGLKKRKGYGQHFRWQTSGRLAQDYYSSSAFENSDGKYRELCASISMDETEFQIVDCDDQMLFICETELDCIPGRFGPDCQSECHCMGTPCDTRQDDLTCKWGCEPGWTGPSCSKPKEQPEVRYFCINSPEEHVGSYVDVHIHTKGVNYRSIYAQMANSTEKGPWCSGTTVSPTEDPYEHVSITMKMNETIEDEIRDGICVGQEVAGNQFEWTLVIQEFEGILLDSDIQVVISCDFNTSETLQRDVQSGQSGTQTFAEKVELTPETTDVILEVVHPYTQEIITEAPVGTSVKLQIKFGFQEGSLVKGVRPHHCVATTPDGQMFKELLGHNGCAVPGSPVESFSKDVNSTTSISTMWFPIFAFPAHDEVEFKCNFELCFHSDDCQPGCREHSGRYHRHRREASKVWPEFSTGDGMDWRSSVIRILPDHILPLKQSATNDPAVTEKQHNRNNRVDMEKDRKKQHSREGEPRQTGLRSTKTPPTSSKSEVKGLYSPLLGLVACGMLLLLLLIVTVMFLTFHFSLRRTVEDLRQEMLLERRSRDRFLYGDPKP